MFKHKHGHAFQIGTLWTSFLLGFMFPKQCSRWLPIDPHNHLSTPAHATCAIKISLSLPQSLKHRHSSRQRLPPRPLKLGKKSTQTVPRRSGRPDTTPDLLKLLFALRYPPLSGRGGRRVPRCHLVFLKGKMGSRIQTPPPPAPFFRCGDKSFDRCARCATRPAAAAAARQWLSAALAHRPAQSHGVSSMKAANQCPTF